jgi:tRNA1Val (adenine37-N6)-methyltransferase
MSEILSIVNDGIRLIQNQNGLKFGTDALLLAAFIRRAPRAEAVEIGPGSGIISLLLASRGKINHITAVEVQPYYADLTARNAAENGLSDRITSVCGDIRDYGCSADIVFTNPPYMRAESGKNNFDEGKYIARHEVKGTIGELCSAAGRLLQTGGRFYCVYRPERLPDLLDAMRQAKIQPKRLCFVHSDTVHPPSLFLIGGIKDGKPGCDVTRPLFLARDGGPTAEAQHIYDTGDWFE